MLCLGGAKNHLVVVPDADQEMTSSTVVASATGCAGQRCMAASVMVAVGEVDHIIEGMVKNANNMNLGQDMGSIINPQSVERITRYINEAEEAGAKVLVDGRNANVEDAKTGLWIGPTIIDNVKPEMSIAKEEVFGPASLIGRDQVADELFVGLEPGLQVGSCKSLDTIGPHCDKQMCPQQPWPLILVVSSFYGQTARERCRQTLRQMLRQMLRVLPLWYIYYFFFK